MTSEEIFRRDPFAVLDGGLSTALEAAGHDLRDELWTARLLVDAPDAVIAAHRSFVEAGAEVLISASYQASVAGLVAAGCSPETARSAIRGSTELARLAGPEVCVVASVGPYGAVLGDGSEYDGRYEISDAALRRFHADRMALLLGSEPDLIAIETIPSLREVEIVLGVLDEYPEARAWLSVTGGDGEHTWSGDAVESIGALAADCPRVVAVGVNCVAPQLVEPMLERLASRFEGPLVAYPNHGRTWDGTNHCWIGDDQAVNLAALVGRWHALGARLIGGCCGYGVDLVRRLVEIRRALRV
jgi:homocysteine S-methyltransferase